MSDEARVWVLYDSRAADGDTSEASVVDTAWSRAGAKREVRSRMRAGETVYAYSYVYSYTRDTGGKLTDERGPYRFGSHLGKGRR